MHIVILILLFLGAHFAATALVPGPKASLIWPFGAESRLVIAGVGGLPTQSGSSIIPLLAALAVLTFAAALAALIGFVVPAGWFAPLIITGALASALLHLLFAGPWAILPIAVDVILLWGVLLQGWTVTLLRGG